MYCAMTAFEIQGFNFIPAELEFAKHKRQLCITMYVPRGRAEQEIGLYKGIPLLYCYFCDSRQLGKARPEVMFSSALRHNFLPCPDATLKVSLLIC